MGHLLVNYYRKKGPKDENIPKVSLWRGGLGGRFRLTPIECLAE